MSNASDGLFAAPPGKNPGGVGFFAAPRLYLQTARLPPALPPTHMAETGCLRLKVAGKKGYPGDHQGGKLLQHRETKIFFWRSRTAKRLPGLWNSLHLWTRFRHC